jgi:cytosine/adenosine deaminase-related metal-dependent hydrolase
MTHEYSVSGTALIGDELEAREVTIVVKDGIITTIEDESRVPPHWICPAFFNAHTHLADTVAMDIPCTGTLEELVTPPNGLKHTILAQTPHADLIAAITDTITEMIHTGTAGCADFREGGKEGVLALQQAASGLPFRSIILGREGGEEIGAGAGISSARDIATSIEIAEKMKKQGKIVWFSRRRERDRGDIEQALDAHPDFLVHCTHATPSQIRRIADEQIPVVLCCRSNFASPGHPWCGPSTYLRDAKCWCSDPHWY